MVASSSSKHDKQSALSRNTHLLCAGILSGLAQAAVFNPWDRALYLSVMHHRPFLRAENFRKPMAGVLQTITQRAISSGLYFPLEDIFYEQLLKVNSHSDKPSSHRTLHFVAGLLAGSTNGLILNPFSSVKFHYWGKAECGKESFFATASDMYKRGGIRCFFVGASATIYRDLIFGGFFALCRHEQLLLIRHKNGEVKQPTATRAFIVNVISATVATILSSPHNYVRVVHYATAPDEVPKGTVEILRGLLREVAHKPTLYKKLHHLQNRLRIGWGTARVGFGMAFSAALYDYFTTSFSVT